MDAGKSAAGGAEVVLLDGRSLDIGQVLDVARNGALVRLSPACDEGIARAEALVERLVAEGRVVYGVTTGFGKFADVAIDRENVAVLQKNLIRSHATAVGAPLPEEVVRAMMLLRLNALVKGYSGVKRATLDLLAEMLNRGVHPVIPEKGSVGASGDLAPLAHLALVLIGEGEATWHGERLSGSFATARLPGAEALARAGLRPVELGPKEGLGLINGTQAMTALGALSVADGRRLAKVADIGGAMSLEALKGTMTAFSLLIQGVRPHQGQTKVAENFHRLTQDSAIIESHRFCQKVQDAYSIRCIPQVHGASRDALAYVEEVIRTEMNSATDNPLVFASEEAVLSGGNFHGQPVAIALDFLGIALAEWASISERRVARLLDPALSGLPAFLAEEGGLNSGLMISQYTAAALVSENKVLAHPASVDSIPTSANQEDHVSMGTIAARKARTILEHAETVLAIELLCAAQALDFQRPLLGGAGTERAHEVIRRRVPHLAADRVVHDDVMTCLELIRSGELVGEVEAAVGELN